MNIVAVGSIAFDTIKTPFAQGKRVLGGSLTYFSLAARYFSPVYPIGVAGTDFGSEQLKVLRKPNINWSGLQILPGKTFTWSGRYGYDLNQRKTLALGLNVLANFRPQLSAEQRLAPYLFLGNMDPELQFNIFRQMKKPRLVVADTMDHWITHKKSALLKMLKQVDILIINEGELRQLAKQSNIFKAANVLLEMMKPSSKTTLIAKQGEYGLLMFRAGHMSSLPAFPVEDVLDPTGAGDTFAGGFLGALVKQKKFDNYSLRQAASYGTVMASFCVEKLGPSNLMNLTRGQIQTRYKLLHKFSGI